MNRKIVLSLGVILILFTGCGGSGSGDDGGNEVTTGTGYYIDSAVAGVDYTCGKESGVTASDGKFTFENGKDCTFSVAGVELRKVEAEKLADEVKIVEDKPEVAVFLQSIDYDGNVSNGIDIKPEVLAVLKTALQENNIKTVPTDDNLTVVVNEVKNEVSDFNGTVVTQEQAMEHVKSSQESVVKELLAEKTLYFVTKSEDGIPDIFEGTFNSSLTQLTLVNQDGSNKSETEGIKIEGNRLFFLNDDDNSYTIIEKKSEYILFDDRNADGTKNGFGHYAYYDKTKAEAYYNSLKNGSDDAPANSLKFTKEWLKEHILYNAYDEDDKWTLSKFTFTDTIMHGEDVINPNDFMDVTYSITPEGYITAPKPESWNEGDGNFTIAITDINDTAMKICWTSSENIQNCIKDGREDEYFFFNYQIAKNFIDKKNDDANALTNDLKALLAGKTFYEVDKQNNGTYINQISFDSVMSKLTFVSDVGSSDEKTEYIDISYSNGKLNFITDGGYTQFKAKTATYIDLADSDGETTRLYFSKAEAEKYLQSGNNLAITQEMLNGKTFYYSRPDGEDIDYKRMSFSNGTYYAAKVNVDKDGTVGSLESIEFPYSLENGYIRYTTDKEVGHIVLKSQDSSTWNVRIQAIDDPSNGTDVVLYLTKPANFPSAL